MKLRYSTEQFKIHNISSKHYTTTRHNATEVVPEGVTKTPSLVPKGVHQDESLKGFTKTSP